MRHDSRARLCMTAALLAAALLLPACDSPLDPRASMEASVRADGIQLFNTTERDAYYFIVNTDALPLINWAQCVGEGCAAVAAGERVVVPLESPLRDGGESGRLTVYWWHAEHTPDGGVRPGRLYFRSVTLDP